MILKKTKYQTIVFLLCGLSLLSSIYGKALDSSKVVIALNCGSKSEEVSPSEGSFKYVPDIKYVKGQSIDVDYHSDQTAVDAQIKYELQYNSVFRFTFDKQVYLFERHTYKEMTYELPVKTGKHTLILKFAEMYFKNKGQRVFNIKIGNTVIVENFDIIEKSGGKYAAHEEFIEIDVKKDGVYYNEARVSLGIQNQKLKLSFAKGKSDNPIIQAIIVYNEAIENSPKKDFELMKKKWDSQKEMLRAKKEDKQIRQLAHVQKKKERVVIRNDQLIVDEEEGSQGSVAHEAEKYGTIRKVMMGPIGIVTWSLIFGYGALFCYKNVLKMGAEKLKPN